MSIFSGEDQSSFLNWSQEIKNNVNLAVEKDCPWKPSIELNRLSQHDHLRCQFNSAMNALLESMNTPYDKLGFKKTVDGLTEIFINQVYEHNRNKDCYDAEGTGLEFCLFIASIGGKSVETGMDLMSYVPGPMGKEAKVANELIEHLDDTGTVKKISTVVIKPKTEKVTDTSYYFEQADEMSKVLKWPPNKRDQMVKDLLNESKSNVISSDYLVTTPILPKSELLHFFSAEEKNELDDSVCFRCFADLLVGNTLFVRKIPSIASKNNRQFIFI